jgi:hypothetical protein
MIPVVKKSNWYYDEIICKTFQVLTWVLTTPCNYDYDSMKSWSWYAV